MLSAEDYVRYHRAMSPAELPESFESRLTPETSAATTVLLDLSSPIDQALLRFAEAVDAETTPTQLEQRAMARALLQKQQGAEAQIAQSNEGLIAAIIHPFKMHDPALDLRLFGEATRSLIGAAALYARSSPSEGFTDFVAPRVQASLVELYPWFADSGLFRKNQRPSVAIYRFLSTLSIPETAEATEQLAEQYESSRFTNLMYRHKDILQYLHFTNEAIVEDLGISVDSVYSVIKEFTDTFPIQNRAELALRCAEAGLSFVGLRRMPEGVTLSPNEALVAPHIHRVFAEASSELGVEVRMFNKVSSSLRRKFSARSRTELALMIKASSILDTSEEAIHPALEGFTPYERKVLPYIYLDSQEVADILSLSLDGVQGAISRASERIGVGNRRKLALNLLKNGFEFSIAEPKRPLYELFTTEQLSLAANLHLTNAELAEMFSIPLQRVSSQVHWFQLKSGARTRTELLLMAHQFDTGERRERDTRTKREKLADKLGWAALDVDRLQYYLDKVGHRQRILISSYYLSDESVTWRTVAEQHELDRTLAIVTARSGVLRIRKQIEKESAA
jgi:DNA-binding CsgD family transcriptional regulator